MRRTLATCLLAALLASSCASTAPGGSSGTVDIPDDAVNHTGSAQVTVEITDNAFTDRIIVVSPGTEVVWVNTGRNVHNVRPAAKEPGAGWFAEITGETLEGGPGSVTFDNVGDYPYFCSFHGTARRGQRGRVIVVPG
jgi:plastocyanin